MSLNIDQIQAPFLNLRHLRGMFAPDDYASVASDTTNMVEAAFGAAGAFGSHGTVEIVSTYALNRTFVPWISGVRFQGQRGGKFTRSAAGYHMVQVPTNVGHLTFDGVEFDGARGSFSSNHFNLLLNGTRCRVNDCYIHDSPAIGLAMDGSIDQYWTGDGVTKSFTMSQNAGYAVLAWVGGSKWDNVGGKRIGVDYTVSGNVVTFTSAPPNGWLVSICNHAFSSQHNHVSNCFVYHNATMGVTNYNTYGCKLLGGEINTSGNEGLTIDVDTDGFVGIGTLIEGSNSGVGGIGIDGARHVSLQGMTIRNSNGMPGIGTQNNYADTLYLSIAGCHFRNSGTHGIHFKANAINFPYTTGATAVAKNCSVEGGSITGSGGSPIYIDSGCIDIHLSKSTQMEGTVTDYGWRTRARDVPGAQRHAFKATRNGDIQNVTGDGTTYTVPFNNSVLNSPWMLNTTNGVFTPQISGTYLLEASVRTAGASSATWGEISIVTPSDTRRTGMNYDQNGTGGVQIFHLSSTFELNAGDSAYVTIRVGGDSKVVDVIGDYNETFFCGALING